MTALRRGAHAPTAGPGLALAEVALLAVHLAVAVGFGRLYDGNGYLGDLVAFTVVAHAFAAAVRRFHLPAAVGAVVGLGGAALLATWLLFPDTATAGLPTGATLDAAREAMDSAGAGFREVAAPTAPLVGFQLVGGLALWGAVWFADWAAFRLRTVAEALAPAAIIFVFCSVLGAGRSRFATAVLFAGAVAFFVANHRAHLAEHDRAWLATTTSDGPRSVRRAALGAGAAVVLIGAGVAPILPGYGEEALVSWRDGDSDSGVRTTVSPIVDLRRRLVSQSDREMFRVESEVGSYWRLTALPDFDGRIWSSGGDYGEATGRLPSEGGLSTATEVVDQTVRVQGLSTIWVPVAYEARVLAESTRPLRWDPESSTLIVDSSSDTSDGLRYRVVSQRPVLDADVLRAAGGADPEEITDRYLGLPDAFPALAAREARRATEGMATRYDRARALQDYFRDGSFVYDTDISAGHGNDALVAFLETRRGYCEQFAGAYAAMARAVGIPARVAVGFTQGEPDPLDPGTFQVRGIHAHAWPEVYFRGIGWVPFEPTPGRGIPGAQRYTGVEPQQDDGTGEPATTTTAPTSTTPGSTTPQSSTSITTPREAPVRGTAVQPPPTDPGGGVPTVALWLLAAVALWLAVLLAAPRIRNARRVGEDDARAVMASWGRTLDPVRWATGLRPRPSETHAEFAGRAAPALGDLGPPVEELARLTERAAWDPRPVGPDAAARAAELSERVQREAAAAQTPLQRVRRRLSWREAFGVAAGRAGSDRSRAGRGRDAAPARPVVD